MIEPEDKVGEVNLDANDMHKLRGALMQEKEIPPVHTIIEMVFIGVGIIVAIVLTIQHLF